ncbi:MAG: IS4 family transposase [Actinobacteria bacterium]|nr:IS4 family transposase [Actinomycetota bacterium]
MSAKSVITRVVTVAGGRFAPGHLGELTQIVPFEMVDAVLAETGKVQVRVRALPSRVVVYLLLAAGLFAELGYGQVRTKMITGLDGLKVATPVASALAQARRRIGVAPLRALFDLLRGPAAGPATKGVYWRGLLVTAIDGTMMCCQDTTANLRKFRRGGGHHGGTGYPMIRMLALVACGTRTVIDATFGTTSIGETTYTRDLLRALHRGMIVLADRNFAAQALIAAVADTGAELLVRVKAGRNLPVCRRLRDGSYVSRIGPVEVRVISCEITIATSAGHQTGVYRLVSTIVDPDCPAEEIVRLYHDRWEIETAFLELKQTILGGRVLRSRTPTGVEQEIYALLVTYQTLRIAIADATIGRPDVDPDRGSFTITLNAARDQLVKAAGVIADTVIDLVGTIGRHVLDNLMPDRRLRTNPRVVKRAISKYAASNARGRVRATSYKATININILAGNGP